MQENHLVILCTVPDRESGEKIAQSLVENRLAACVNLVPGLVSIYRWEGAVKKDSEVLMVIKTDGARFEAVRAAITKLHSYDVPEIIALPITAGDPNYLNWLIESSK